ncbi:hypothetical protein D3C78_669290 [compost metagenome]
MHLIPLHAHTSAFCGAENSYTSGLHRPEETGIDTAGGDCEVIDHLAVSTAHKIATYSQVEVVPGSERAPAVNAWGNQL